MSSKFILSLEEFTNSKFYSEFKNEENKIMSFQEFTKSVSENQTIDYVVLTFDLSGTKKYGPIKKFLTINKFLTQLPNGQLLPRNTYVLIGSNLILNNITNSIVNFIKTKYIGKKFRVLSCITNSIINY